MIAMEAVPNFQSAHDMSQRTIASFVRHLQACAAQLSKGKFVSRGNKEGLRSVRAKGGVMGAATIAGRGASSSARKRLFRWGVITVVTSLPALSFVVAAQDVRNDPGVTVHGSYKDLFDDLGGPAGLSSYSPPQNPSSYMPSIGKILSDLVKKPFSSGSQVPSVNCKQNPSGGGDKGGDPVLFSSGSKIETFPLFELPGEMGLKFALYYNSGNAVAHWTTTFDYLLDSTCTYGTDCNLRTLHRPDGSMVAFTGGANDTSYPIMGNGVEVLTRDPASGRYTLRDEDGSTQIYSPKGAILSIVDASGIGWTFTYNADGTLLTSVTHTNGQSIGFSYTLPSGGTPTVTITDPAGNTYSYIGTELPASYKHAGTVTSINFPGSPATNIGLQSDLISSDVMLREVDYNGKPYALTTYDRTVVGKNSDGTPIFGRFWDWATSTSYADGSGKTTIVYNTDTVDINVGDLVATITNPLGHVTTNTYAGVNGLLSNVADGGTSTCGPTAHTRTYDSNGNLSKAVDNNGNVHTYNYAANGQLQTETEAAGTSLARKTDYVWDPNATLNRLLSVTVEGVRKTTYTYNAQNRIASVSVTNLSANGIAGQTLTTSYQYALYGNGLVQTMTVTKPSSNGSDTDTYRYDGLGRLTSFTNGLGQTTSYSNYNGLGEPGTVTGPNGDTVNYTYDARGRVSTKTTHPNGGSATWSYGYDGFGLLSSLSGPDGQVTVWNRDQVMRVRTIVHNDKDGTSTESFQYDANGDIAQHTIARGNTTSLIENFTYDGLGRLYQSLGQHGQSLNYAYDGNGNVLSVTNAMGHVTSHQYDALNRVTQTSESGGASPPIPSSAPGLNAPASNASGTYTVSWNSISAASAYVLQEQVNGGGWNTMQNGGALSWSASGKANNSYGYRVQACNTTGCGPWSGVVTVNVAVAGITSAPSVSVPGSSNRGTYTVSWSTVNNAASYNLQEQANGGSWTNVQPAPGAATSWSTTGRGGGTYSYQAQACNTAGCGPWSSAASIVVSLVPTAPTNAVIRDGTIGKPDTSTFTDVYDASWDASSLATRYEVLRVQTGVTIYSGTALTTRVESGRDPYDLKYSYQVRACNDKGCSAWVSLVY
jgi:YD repeat-containing protein